MTNRIPKIIHYCWFGKGEKNKTIVHCMKSWKRYCKDYKFMEWNEDTFNIASSPLYVQQAYASKKWAFVSDYVRLWALEKFGGIYLDTDVEVIKPLDRFLRHRGFSGFSEVTYQNYQIPAAVLGSERGNPYIKYLLSYYSKRKFIKSDGSLDIKANIFIITEMTLEKYLFELNDKYQEINGFGYYPHQFFTPRLKHHNRSPEISPETYAIHYHNESWMPPLEKLKINLLILLSYLGLKKPLRYIFNSIRRKK